MTAQQKIRFKAVGIIIAAIAMFNIVEYIENNCSKRKRVISSYKR
jgi:hypothetical protein